jgi:F-type H+-transporting ATPase subunit b
MDSLKTLGFDPGVLLINIVGFILLLWFFRRYLYGPIGLFMGERTREIEKQIAEARQLNDEAKQRQQQLQAELQQEREAAREDIARMTQEARAAIEEMQSEGRRQRQETIEAGRRELERSKDIALAELRRTVGDLAVEISGKVIREALDETRQEALIDEFLHDIEQVAREQRPDA